MSAPHAADMHRGWSITPARWPEPWTGTSPDFDASYEGEEDGWVGNGQQVTGQTREAVVEAINDYIEDMQP